MNRLKFIKVAAAFCAVLATKLGIRRREIHFYWVYEGTEIYAAHDLAELNEIIDGELGTGFTPRWCKYSKRMRPDRDWEECPRLSNENRETHWKEVSDQYQMYEDEERTRLMTLREIVALHPKWNHGQICTAYA